MGTATPSPPRSPGDFLTHLPWQIFNLPRSTDLDVRLIHQPFFVAFQLLVPFVIGFSVLYYDLWEIDFVVSRTVLYAMIATAAAVLWEAVNLTSAKLIEKARGPQSGAFAGGPASVITGFFLKPMYVPIVVPRAKNPDLLGVLYLSRRDGEKGYSQLEVAALEALGRKGGMALYLSEARIATAPSAPARNLGVAESS